MIFHCYVSLPEGNSFNGKILELNLWIFQDAMFDGIVEVGSRTVASVLVGGAIFKDDPQNFKCQMGMDQYLLIPFLVG